MSMNITSVYYCDQAVALDNGGEVEITLLTATGSDKAIRVGPNGSASKIRAVNFNMVGTNNYDLEVMSSDAQIDLMGAQMDESKINNPNKVKINAQFHGNKGGKKYQAIIFKDGKNAHRHGSDYKKEIKEVDASTTMTLDLAPGGGWVARIIEK